MDGMVYAVTTAQVMLPDSSMVLIREGEPRTVGDPVVKFRPDLFSADVESKSTPTSIGPNGVPVEQATAAPGEKRNVRR